MFLRICFHQSRLRIAILATLLLLLQSNASVAQDSIKPDPSGLHAGPMQQITDVVQKILRLKVNNGKTLKLDEESWKTSPADAEAAIEALIKQYMARGLDPASARQIAVSQNKNNSARNRTPLDGLFVQLSGGGMTSGGRSSSGNSVTLSRRGSELRCNAVLVGSDFEFKVAETAGRQLTFTSSGKMVRILFTDDDLIAILTQSKSGKVIGIVTGEKTLTGSSSDYKQFGNQHQELDQRLRQIFSHAGVDFPPTPHDPVVRQLVLDRIKSSYSNSSAELDVLIQDLDASDYASREAATQTIIAEFQRFENWIANRLADDSLAFEAKKRLDKIMKDEQKTQQRDARVDQCVDSNELLRSPEYLVGLLDSIAAQDQTLVMKLLGDLTQETLGDDVIAWQEWATAKTAIAK